MNNCAFGTIAGLQKAHYGTTFGTRVREGRQALFAGLRGHRPGLRHRRRADRVGRRVQAGAGAGDRVGQRPCVHRRDDGERAGADGWPLEHHGHLLAGPRGLARRRAVALAATA